MNRPEETCVIWGTPAVAGRSGTRDTWIADSPRAGGEYEVSGTALMGVQNLPPEQKAVLTTWLVNARRSGDLRRLITTDTIKDIKSRTLLTVTERCDRVLSFLGSKLPQLGDAFRAGGNLDNEVMRNRCELCAHAEAQSEKELVSILRYLEKRGWIEIDQAVNVTLSLMAFCD
jgi:hypothetical protein